MAEIIRKTLSFGENEQDLYDFCMENSEKQGKKFATFVKDVLRGRMNNEEPLESLIDKRIKEYLKDKNVTVDVVEEENAISISKYDDDDKSSLKNFLTGKK
ncbi:hypothetical protein LGL08_20660 [Clostridium estertheticum]|uniref:hypothetical protein n=1 Tax=Clostridium estertheticum TaxID=238834 RepID=UPI001CF4196E|nr:hypothetical protein [Clostridium estertheticum]MCB2308879.1 hypothetical protein [Clostridium estertheticum]MCB2347291.1 hypothetical protein [Clostridium estertheticum]MCB2351942.1 hypothetical protein [Clostridium estertheticum]WAG48493.1 hypothetical protein LL127_23520 [Clostridium estertheticum]